MIPTKRKYNTQSNRTSFQKGHPGMIGKDNPGWKGDKAGYGAIHDWVKSHFGKPDLCEHCDKTGKGFFEWANISKKYKRDRTDWLRLCKSCHHKYDNSRQKAWVTRKKKHKTSVVYKILNSEVVATFNSVTEAAQSIGVVQSAVSMCIHGHSNTCGGYHWSYQSPEILEVI